MPEIFEIGRDDLDERDELDDLIAEYQTDPRFTASLADAHERSHLLNQLVALRKGMNLTQKTIADRMGTTQSAVSEFECGSSDYFISTAQRFARAATGRVRVILEMPCDGPWGESHSRYVKRDQKITTSVPQVPAHLVDWCDAWVKAR